MELKERREALLFFHNERRIERDAREAYSQALHDILKNRHLLGLVYREDGYVPVKELVRDLYYYYLLRKYITHSYLVELSEFSNVIFPKSSKGGARGSIE